MECTQSAADYWRELYESAEREDTEEDYPRQDSCLGRQFYWTEVTS